VPLLKLLSFRRIKLRATVCKIGEIASCGLPLRCHQAGFNGVKRVKNMAWQQGESRSTSRISDGAFANVIFLQARNFFASGCRFQFINQFGI